MYKTVWVIHYNNDTVELTWYHFGKEPKFPTWYMEENIVYEIEMIWNLKLILNFNTFFQMFNSYLYY